MATPAIFSLSSKGIITDPLEILRTVFKHGLCANKSQTLYFSNQTLSIQYVRSQYGGEPEAHANNLETELLRAYRAYFTQGEDLRVNVEVINKTIDSYDLKISARVIANGETYHLYQALKEDSSQTIEDIIEGHDTNAE